MGMGSGKHKVWEATQEPSFNEGRGVSREGKVFPRVGRACLGHIEVRKHRPRGARTGATTSWYVCWCHQGNERHSEPPTSPRPQPESVPPPASPHSTPDVSPPLRSLPKCLPPVSLLHLHLHSHHLFKALSLPTKFYTTSITLAPKPDTDIARKENYSSISSWTLMQKS